MKAPKDEQRSDEVTLYDYVLSFQEGDKLVVDSIAMKIKYYEAYLKALEKLRSDSS